MARLDDYKQAAELGRTSLSKKDPSLIADVSGVVVHRDTEGNTVFHLHFLNRRIAISWPDLKFSYRDSEEALPIQQQILLLHYLDGTGNGIKRSGEWISFQEVPDGRFYMGAFIKRAKDPLVHGFGGSPEQLTSLATKVYNASPFDHGDHAVVVEPLPLIPMALVLWEGDEEFPPDGNILFDSSISKILSAEDIAWLAGMVIYPLIGMAKAAE